MLTIKLPNSFFRFHRNPSLSTPLFRSIRACSPLLSWNLVSFGSTSIYFSMDSATVVAEYAKSKRSSCKGCGKTISRGFLRLGLTSRDPRGYDMTKWHHLDCFPMGSHPLNPAGEIKGFSSLKNCDQIALKKFEAVASSNQSPPSEDNGADKAGATRSEKKSSKKRKADVSGLEASEESSMKKQQLSRTGEGDGLEIVLSTSDKKNNYKDATLPPKWKAFQTIIFLERDEGLEDSEKIAAFDFDGCLVNTSVKRIGPDAWSLLYPSIPEKLESLYKSGYKLVIFTNESNIERWKNKRQQAVDSKVGRLDNFIKLVKVPMQVFIACGLGKSKDQTDDRFRKPKPGMWKIMEKYFNSGIPIDMDQSFYVGDAAGRVNDHSDADIKFAEAIGLKFHVPEVYFSA